MFFSLSGSFVLWLVKTFALFGYVNKEFEFEFVLLQLVLYKTKVTNKSLIIGSSLIRNFDEAKLKNHKVCCMPGAQTADVKTKLNNLAEDGNHYKSIFIVVGGNDASASEDKVDVESAVSSMRDIITSCKRMSDDITISAIPPRAEPAHALAMIHCLNVHFQAIAADMSVKFVTNDEHFYLKNGQINDGYFHDSVHLTVKGSNKLAETLGLLNVVNGKNDGVCSYKPVQDKCFEHKINGNNDDNFDHTFWDRAKQKSRPQNRGSRLVQRNQSTFSPSVTSSNHVAKQPVLNHHFSVGQGGRSGQVHRYQDGDIGRHRALQPQLQNQLASVGTKRQGFQPSMNSRILSENPPSRGGQARFAPNGYSQHRTPPGRRGHPLHPAPGRPGHQGPPADRRHASVHSGANARTPMQHSRALGGNQRPTAQHQYGPERSRPEFRHNDQAKKKSYADQLRPSDRCTFCGEGNHREWSCKYGQPITCFSCNNDGHKAKYCEFFLT